MWAHFQPGLLRAHGQLCSLGLRSAARRCCLLERSAGLILRHATPRHQVPFAAGMIGVATVGAAGSVCVHAVQILRVSLG